MKLSLEKCAFKVSSGNVFGFMVSRRGIEENLEKIRTVIKIKSPCTLEEI